MIPSSRGGRPLRGILLVMAIALASAIAGCDAGASAPTQQWHQPTAGASAVLNHTIRINNVFVLGAPPASSLAQGDSAGLFLALSNDGASPAKLIGVSAPGTAASVQLPGNGISVASQQSVLLTGPAPQIVLRNLTRSLGGGQSIRVVLDFLKAGTVTLQVPVMPQAQEYVTFSPAPSPSPATTGTPQPGLPASPSPSPATPAPSG